MAISEVCSYKLAYGFVTFVLVTLKTNPCKTFSDIYSDGKKAETFSVQLNIKELSLNVLIFNHIFELSYIVFAKHMSQSSTILGLK